MSASIGYGVYITSCLTTVGLRMFLHTGSLGSVRLSVTFTRNFYCVYVGGGGAKIFIYIRRLGPFLEVQNLEFQYFWGVSEISLFLGV